MADQNGINSDFRKTLIENIAEWKKQGLTDDQIRGMVSGHLEVQPEITRTPDKMEAFFSGLRRDAGELIGSTVGTVAATKFGATGRTAAAFAGGAIGKGSQMLYEKATGEWPQPLTEIAKASGMAGLRQAGAQAAGEAVIGTAGRIIAPLRKEATSEARFAQEYLKPYGAVLTGAQRTEGKGFINWLEGVARGGMTSKTTMETADEATDRALRKAQGDLSKLYYEDLKSNLPDYRSGQILLNTLRGGDTAHKDMAIKMAGALDESIAAKVEALGPVAQGVNIQKLTELGPNMDKVLKHIAVSNRRKEYGGLVSFKEAQEIRAGLLSIGRGAEPIETLAKLDRQSINMAVTEMNSQMKVTAERLGGDIFQQWKAFNSFYRQGKRAFDDELVTRILTDDKIARERIGDELFKSGNITEVLGLKRALFAAKKYDPSLKVDEAWGGVQRGYFEAFLSKNSKNGILDAASMEKFLNDPLQRRTYNVAFTLEQRNRIGEFIRAAKVAQFRHTEEGRVVIQLVQGGVLVSAGTALVGMATGSEKTRDVGLGGAITFLAGPKAIAYLLTSKSGARYLTNALRMPKGSPLAAGLAVKIAAEAANAGYGEDLRFEPGIGAAVMGTIRTGVGTLGTKQPELRREQGGR